MPARETRPATTPGSARGPTGTARPSSGHEEPPTVAVEGEARGGLPDLGEDQIVAIRFNDARVANLVD